MRKRTDVFKRITRTAEKADEKAIKSRNCSSFKYNPDCHTDRYHNHITTIKNDKFNR